MINFCFQMGNKINNDGGVRRESFLSLMIQGGVNKLFDWYVFVNFILKSVKSYLG